MIKRPADIVPPPKSSPVVDTLNRDGAMALAKRLEKYWHDQGYPAARFWTEPLDERFAKIDVAGNWNRTKGGDRRENSFGALSLEHDPGRRRLAIDPMFRQEFS